MDTKYKACAASSLSSIIGRRTQTGRDHRRSRSPANTHGAPCIHVINNLTRSLFHSSHTFCTPRPNFTPTYTQAQIFPFILHYSHAVTCTPFQSGPCCLNLPFSFTSVNLSCFPSDLKPLATRFHRDNTLRIHFATNLKAKLRSRECVALLVCIIIACNHWINMSKENKIK